MTEVKKERWVQILEGLKDFRPEGNVIPAEWFAHLKFDNGKPDVNAMLILSDIVYWYRPTQVRDEETGMVIGYKKKFKADLLQKSYNNYAGLFGFSKEQVTDAVVRLEKRGLIKRIFRTIKTDSVTLNNVLFIDLNVEKLKQLSGKSEAITSQGDTLSGYIPTPSPDISPHPLRIYPDTYTENTTDITTERDARTRANDHPSGDPLPEENNLPKESKKKKGSALDINWTLPDQWREWSIQCGMMNEEIDLAEFKFREYWVSTTKNPTKKNWFSTWKIWCVNDYERKGMILKVKNHVSVVDSALKSPYKTTTSLPNSMKVKHSSDPKIQQWNELQGILKERIGEVNYESWIERHLDPVKLNGKAVFNVTSNFARDRITQKFGDDLMAILAKIDPKFDSIRDIEFIEQSQECNSPFPDGYIKR